MTSTSRVQFRTTIYQHWTILALPRDRDSAFRKKGRQRPQPTIRLTRFTEEKFLIIGKHAVVSSEIESVIGAEVPHSVRVPRVKFFDFGGVFQNFSNTQIAVDNMLDRSFLLIGKGSIRAVFCWLEHPIEQEHIPYTNALLIKVFCGNSALSKGRFPILRAVLQYIIKVRVKVAAGILFKIKGWVKLMNDFFVGKSFIGDFVIAQPTFSVRDR